MTNIRYAYQPLFEANMENNNNEDWLGARTWERMGDSKQAADKSNEERPAQGLNANEEVNLGADKSKVYFSNPGQSAKRLGKSCDQKKCDTTRFSIKLIILIVLTIA